MHERFERKSKLLERQKSLELELERENIMEAENPLKLLELKDDHNLNKENSLSDMEHPFICPSQTANHKHFITQRSNTSLPNEPPLPQSPSYSQCHHNKTVTDKINLETLESYNPEPVDQFIDYLIEGKETVIPGKEETTLNLINTLHHELETRNLPIVNLVSFERNPCNWPKFIANIKSRIHFKQSFSDNMPKARLPSVLKGEVKNWLRVLAKVVLFMQQH